MENQKPKLPKKGATKRITERWKKILETPIPQEVFDIVHEAYEEEQKKKKLPKVARSNISDDLEA